MQRFGGVWSKVEGFTVVNLLWRSSSSEGTLRKGLLLLLLLLNQLVVWWRWWRHVDNINETLGGSRIDGVMIIPFMKPSKLIHSCRWGPERLETHGSLPWWLVNQSRSAIRSAESMQVACENRWIACPKIDDVWIRDRYGACVASWCSLDPGPTTQQRELHPKIWRQKLFRFGFLEHLGPKWL